MTGSNPNARLEAFCDAVFAIAMTLLVIDVRLPSTETIASTGELWRARRGLAPTIFAFVFSFGIILITWVNHQAAMKLVNKSSPAFIYANGLLLLTVVVMPFPTSLMGAFVLTDRAAPAVVLFMGVLALQAVAWIILAHTVLTGGLAGDERSATTIRGNQRHGYVALVIYGVCAIGAFWYPLAIAILSTMTFIFWLVLSLTMKPAAAA